MPHIDVAVELTRVNNIVASHLSDGNVLTFNLGCFPIFPNFLAATQH